MHVFVTGGSGLTGPAVVAELIAAGHTVTGLARSDAAARLESLGATPHRGSLDDLDSLRSGAEASDGVLHMAYGGDFSDLDDMMRRDVAAIETLGRSLEHSGKPLVVTSGTPVMPAGRETTEKDEPGTAGIGAFRIAGERAGVGFAARGVRASVVRLASAVHGPHDHGFIPCSSPPRGRPASRPTSATAPTGGPRRTGSTRRSCTGWRWRRRPRAACCTGEHGDYLAAPAA